MRKKKFVVWLHNHTDLRDDEWVAVWATNADEASENAEYDSNRFSKGRVLTATEFRKEMGFGA